MSVPNADNCQGLNNKMTIHTFCKVSLDKTCNMQFLCHYIFPMLQLQYVNLRFPEENNALSLLFKPFSAKHAALRRKNKDWLARNQNNVSEWRNMSTRRLLFK